MPEKEQKADFAFTLIVPKNQSETEKFNIRLRELDEPTFIAAQKLLQNGKMLDSIRFIVRSLYVSGDNPEEFVTDFHAVRAATASITELITPLEGELKKN